MRWLYVHDFIFIYESIFLFNFQTYAGNEVHKEFFKTQVNNNNMEEQSYVVFDLDKLDQINKYIQNLPTPEPQVFNSLKTVNEKQNAIKGTIDKLLNESQSVSNTPASQGGKKIRKTRNKKKRRQRRKKSNTQKKSKSKKSRRKTSKT